MPTTDYLVNKWLAVLTDPTTLSYVSLHFAVPPASDPKSTELTSTAYVRKQTYWTTTTRQVANQSALTWTNLTTNAVTHIGVFDGPYSSNLMFYVPLATPYVITGVGSYELAAGDLYLRIP